MEYIVYSEIKVFLTNIVKNNIFYSILFFFTSNISTSQAEPNQEIEKQIEEYIKKNPKIIIDSIMKQYPYFLERTQESSKQLEQEFVEKIEKTLAQNSKKILSLGKVLTKDKVLDPTHVKEGEYIRLALFFDPLCPHCSNLMNAFPEMLKTADEKKLKLAVNLIPISAIDPENSKTIGLFFSAIVQKYSMSKAILFLKSFLTLLNKSAKNNDENSGTLYMNVLKNALNQHNIPMTSIGNCLSDEKTKTEITESTELLQNSGCPAVPLFIGAELEKNGSYGIKIIPTQNTNDLMEVINQLSHKK